MGVGRSSAGVTLVAEVVKLKEVDREDHLDVDGMKGTRERQERLQPAE